MKQFDFFLAETQINRFLAPCLMRTQLKIPALLICRQPKQMESFIVMLVHGKRPFCSKTALIMTFMRQILTSGQNLERDTIQLTVQTTIQSAHL